MTPTSGLPVSEPVFDFLRGAPRLGMEPKTETLLSRTTFLYEWIYDSLMSCLKSKESHRCHIALDTCITLGAEQAGTRDQELAHPDHRPAVSAYVSRARNGVYGGVLWAYGLCTVLYGFLMALADLGRISPYGQSTRNRGEQGSCQSQRKGEPFSGSAAGVGSCGAGLGTTECRPRAARGCQFIRGAAV